MRISALYSRVVFMKSPTNCSIDVHLKEKAKAFRWSFSEMLEEAIRNKIADIGEEESEYLKLRQQKLSELKKEEIQIRKRLLEMDKK